MQSFEKEKRVIIALHEWTGNIFSLQSLTKHWNFPATDWIYIQGLTKQNLVGILGLMGMIRKGGNIKNHSKS